MRNYEIRRSIVSDFEKIEKLLVSCFGERPYNDSELFIRVTSGDLVVATVNNKIVATVGIAPTTHENESAQEIRYACTSPEYRGQGIMHELLSKILSDMRTDKKLICWAVREPGKEHANLSKVLYDLGFDKQAGTEREFTCETCREAYGFRCALENATHDEQCKCHEELWFG